MVTLRAFRALRYNPRVAGDLASNVAPPYDVISDDYRDLLYERSPFNVVRLILNRDEDRYRSAARFLSEWKERQVLVRDGEPSLCFYVEEFKLADGAARRRQGILGTVRLEPLDSGIIRPHERTFARAKEDRLNVLEACRTNLSAIFGLVPGQQEWLHPAQAAAEGRAPDIDVEDDRQTRHRLWFVRDPEVIARVAAGVSSESVVIADGHHRYETALAYQQRMRQKGSDEPGAAHNFILMYLTSMWDPGLVVLPTHRVVTGVPGFDSKLLLRRLRENFRLTEFDAGARGDFDRQLHEEAGGVRIGVVVDGASRFVLAALEDATVMDRMAAHLAPLLRRMDVTVLDVLLLRGALGMSAVEAMQSGRLSFTHADDEALQAVRSGAQAAFLVRPPRMQDVLDVCGSGQTMPEKSTYFYPKLLSGLVFHPFD